MASIHHFVFDSVDLVGLLQSIAAGCQVTTMVQFTGRYLSDGCRTITGTLIITSPTIEILFCREFNGRKNWDCEMRAFIRTAPPEMGPTRDTSAKVDHNML